MQICQDKLYNDVIFWLPEEQELSEPTIRKVNLLVISIVGDDDTKYAEVLCKCLEANARKNQIEYNINEGNVKRQKVDQGELEYFESADNKDKWSEYIKSLSNICPLFGYNKPYTVGIKLSAGKKVTVTDCPTICDLYELDNPFFLCNDSETDCNC